MSVTNTLTLPRQLCDAGFAPEAAHFRHNGMSAQIGRRWLTLQTPAAPGAPADLGQPGLWKTVPGPTGLHREFHLPLDVVAEQAWDEDTGELLDPLGELIQWARITAAGELPENWKCPAADQLRAEVPDGALTVEAGSYARQGLLQCEDCRLAIQFPLLPSVPTDLSDARRAWLQVLLADGQHGCRLVRLAQRTPPQQPTSIVAEVDLSGAPQFAVPGLLHFGLDAARHVVSRLIAAVELLVDPTVTSTVWEFPPVQDRPAEGGQR